MNENETTSENNLSKAERKALRRQEKEQQKVEAAKARQRSKTVKQGIGVLVAVLVIFGLGYMVFSSSDEEVSLDITKECVSHQGLGMHIHPVLTIIANGDKQEIPANVGIASPTCMRPIHTHDDSGKLHIEYATVKDFKLGEFFQIWEKPFSKDQILDYKVDAEHEIVVTVNGQVINDYENLVLVDHDQIVIEYKEKEGTN